MFIKIVRHKLGDVPYREYLQECKGFSLVNRDGSKFVIADPLGEQQVTFDIDPEYEEVYIMNNEGKTIDYYAWAKKEK